MSIFDRFDAPPSAQTLGWRLIEADPDTGMVRVEMHGGQEFCNPGGTIQGGFIAAMLDDTLGPTILVKTGGTHYCATIYLHVSFLAPAQPGRFTGVGRIVQLGRTVASWKASCWIGTERWSRRRPHRRGSCRQRG